MANQTVDRKYRSFVGSNRTFPCAAGEVFFVGSAVFGDAATGNAKRPDTTTTDNALGVCTEAVDNSAGGAGAESVNVEVGIFGFKNSAAADLIDLGDVGATVYAADDQTAALTDGTGTRPELGPVVYVEDDIVYVRVGKY